MSSPFTAANCGYAYNYQLATDVLANNNNQSFIFDCTNTYSSSLPIEPCPYSLTFCIGGHSQQHACTLGACTVIDWSNVHAGACGGYLTNYTSTWQTTGLAPVCCDSKVSLCVSPTPKSYNCSTGADLWLCVVKAGVSAECVKPLDSSICSGNFTSANALPSGLASSSTSIAGTSATSPSSSSTGGISGFSMILIIAFSTLVGVGVIGGMLVWYRRHRQPPAKAKDEAETYPMDYNGPNVPNGSRTDNVMVNRSNLTDVGRDHTTYHIHGENTRIAVMNGRAA